MTASHEKMAELVRQQDSHQGEGVGQTALPVDRPLGVGRTHDDGAGKENREQSGHEQGNGQGPARSHYRRLAGNGIDDGLTLFLAEVDQQIVILRPRGNGVVGDIGGGDEAAGEAHALPYPLHGNIVAHTIEYEVIPKQTLPFGQVRCRRWFSHGGVIQGLSKCQRGWQSTVEGSQNRWSGPNARRCRFPKKSARRASSLGSSGEWS